MAKGRGVPWFHCGSYSTLSELLTSDWFVWGISLIVGFQLLVVLLGEAARRIARCKCA